jgi:hypothetical protein
MKKITFFVIFITSLFFSANAQVTTNSNSGLSLKNYLKVLLLFAFFALGQAGFGQVTVTSSTGTGSPSASYTTLAAAITAINDNATHTGTILCEVVAGHVETAPAGGFSITATGTVSNTITFIKSGSGANPTFTASSTQTVGSITDAIFKIIGGDFITIDGFTMLENAANLTTTAASNNMTEFGVALFYATTTNGAQNNTIRNCTITLNRTYLNTFGIFSSTRTTATVMLTAADASSTAGGNAGNKIYSNTISNVNYGIVFIGTSTAAAFESGNDIGGSSAGTGNTITNWGGGAAASSYISLTGSSYCIFSNHQINDNISYNTITSAALTQSNTCGGILKNYSATQPTGTITSTINNNTVTVTNNPTAATTGGIIGINNQGLTPLLSTATMSMNNNTVQNCVLGGSTSTTNGITAITNFSVPGTMNITGNSVINNAITATTATSGTNLGISNSGAAGTVNLNNNIVRSLASTSASGQIQGIVNSGAVVTALNINSNQLGNATSGFFSTSTATSGALFGISNSGGTATCATSIQSNDIRGIVYNVAGSGANTYIAATGTPLSNNVSNNSFTNLNVNTTGSITFVNHSYTMPAGGSQTLNANSIITAFNKGGAGGTVTGFTSSSSSPNGSTHTLTNNNLSNITITGATTLIGITNSDGLSTSANRTVTGNIFNNWTGGTGAITGMSYSYIGATSTISNNTITNYSGQGAITGLTIGSSFSGGNPLNAANNTITNLVSSGTGGAVNGIVCSNTSTLININDNAINSLSSTGAFVVNGISITGASTTNVFKNKIYDLSGSNASSTVNGIAVSSGTTVTAHNNLIGDLRTPNANAANPLVGINITGSTTSNIYYNTVYLNATSVGALFGSSAISASTTPTVNLRNNIFVNTSTPVGATGFTSAYRRSTTTLTSYASTSNNNIFYSGTPGVNNLIFYDGTNSDQTITAFKARVASRDAASVTENMVSKFLSTAGANANFLHIDTTIATQAESGGAAIAGITVDYDGTTRNATTPDIGADEFIGVAGDFTGPAITNNSQSVSVCTAGSRTITATITDASGVPTSGIGLPVAYWNSNGGTYNAATGVSAGSGVYNFTIASGTNFGDAISYYFVAQDAAFTPNVTSLPLAGASGFTTNPPAVSTAPTTPFSYTVNAPLSGTLTVGTSGNYPTLSAAINSFNSSCLGGAVVFELIDATYNEAGAMTINSNPTASSVNTLTIRPASGVVATISATVASGYVLKVLNSFTTVNGSNNNSTSRNLTISNLSATSPGVVNIGSVGTTSITGVSLRNTIIINGANTATAVMVSDGTTPGNAGYFTSITVQNNSVQRAFIGIYAIATVATGNGNGTVISDNSLNTSGTNAIRLVGIYNQGVEGATVSNNSLGNFDATLGENDYAIWLAPGTKNTIVSNNTITNLGMTLTTGFAPRGIVESSGLVASGNIITNNSISNLTTTGSTAIIGIDVAGGGTIIERNKVSGIINNNTGTYGAYGINISANNNSIIRNNFVSNINGDMTGGGAFSTGFGIFGIRIAAGTGHQVYFNSVNLYGTRPGTATTSLLTAAFAIVTTASTGCDLRNNIFANNLSGGTTSIANVAVYLPSGGTSAMNLTMNNNLYFYGTDTSNSGAGQAGTIAGTNFYVNLPSLLAYSSTLSGAATNDNASFGSATAVPFTTVNDLHITTSNDLGVTISSVPLDIDLNTRTATPDIGAHEFTFNPCATTVTYTAGGWSSTPDATTGLIFDADYTGAGLAGCSCQVNAGKTVTITSGTLDIQNLVEVKLTGNLIMNSGTNLIQANAAITNLGIANIKQNSAPMVRLDYTAWSSPVAGQNLKTFSPATLDNRFYTYDPVGNAYAVVAAPASTNFTSGVGYLLRSPNDSDLTIPVAYAGQFIGIPFNGTRTTPVTIGYNLVGNPYPSKLDALNFLANVTNNGLGITTLHFWTHTVAAVGGVYPTNNYASFNSMGGTAAAAGGATPNGTISVGQGFFVDINTAGNATFLNTMRSTAVSTQFFKSASVVATPSDKHRFWLNLTSPTTANNQILIGYTADSSNDFDAKYDAPLFGDTASVIYSKVADKKLAIQGRINFATTDVLPLGLQATEASQFTISLADFDGLFVNQNIYLRDNVLNTIQDLKVGSYTFNAAQGEFASRFEVVFESSTLSTNSNVFNEASVIVIKNNNGISIETGNNTMQTVNIFDIRGRLLQTKTNINASTITLNNVATANQVLIVKITNTNNETVTKKVVN